MLERGAVMRAVALQRLPRLYEFTARELRTGERGLVIPAHKVE